METISPETRISRAGGFVTAPVNKELMMLNVEQGAYYAMDPIAADIWALIESPSTVSRIVTALQVRYAVSHEQCQADVLRFMARLLENGMILLDHKAN